SPRDDSIRRPFAVRRLLRVSWIGRVGLRWGDGVHRQAGKSKDQRRGNQHELDGAEHFHPGGYRPRAVLAVMGVTRHSPSQICVSAGLVARRATSRSIAGPNPTGRRPTPARAAIAVPSAAPPSAAAVMSVAVPIVRGAGARSWLALLGLLDFSNDVFG